nr:nascent polypeptide-associated complex subunit alpha, muscle-specific form-like [Aegilops tauschii subsp. strangulata]
MPVFDGRGLVPPAPSEATGVVAPVLVSSGDSGEEERPDSEATLEGEGETSPLVADLLGALPDDDEAGDHSVRESQAPAGVTTRSKGTPSKKPSTGAPTRSSAAAGPAAAASSAPGTRKPTPQAARPPGSALLKRPRNYAAVDQPTPAAKKKREGVAAPSGTQQPGTATPPPAQKCGNSPRAAPAWSSSRGAEDRPQEKATSIAKPALEAPALSSLAEVPLAPELPASSSAAINSQILATKLPPPSATPLARDPSASPDALEKALSALTRLRNDLQGADRRLVTGRLELISASEEDKRAADQAAAACEVALKDAEATRERCRAAVVELENLHKEWAAMARQLEVREEKVKAQEEAVTGRDADLEQLAQAQAAERDRLKKLEKEVEAERVQLEIKAKVLAEDREAFKSLEERSREVLRELYEKDLEKPLVTDDDGPAQLLPQLITVLEDVISGIGPMVEGEVRALSSSALTRVLSHLHLRDPNADLGVLLEPVDEERCVAAAKAVKGQVETLLRKFLAIDPAPPADGAADLATKANDTIDGDAVDRKALPDDGTQG